jgi:hypothetical protein
MYYYRTVTSSWTVFMNITETPKHQVPRHSLQQLCSFYLRTDGQKDMARLICARLKPETLNCQSAATDADCSFLFAVSHRPIKFSKLRSWNRMTHRHTILFLHVRYILSLCTTNAQHFRITQCYWPLNINHLSNGNRKTFFNVRLPYLQRSKFPRY